MSTPSAFLDWIRNGGFPARRKVLDPLAPGAQRENAIALEPLTVTPDPQETADALRRLQERRAATTFTSERSPFDTGTLTDQMDDVVRDQENTPAPPPIELEPGKMGVVGRTLGRGLAESGHATLSGIAAVGRTLDKIPGAEYMMGIGPVVQGSRLPESQPENLEAEHEGIRYQYGDPRTTGETVGMVGSRLAGDLAQFALPGSVAGKAGLVGAAGGGLRGLATRAAVNTATSAPITVAQAGDPASSATSFIAETADSPTLRRLASSVPGRVAGDVALDLATSGVLEAGASGIRSIRDAVRGRTPAARALEEVRARRTRDPRSIRFDQRMDEALGVRAPESRAQGVSARPETNVFGVEPGTTSLPRSEAPSYGVRNPLAESQPVAEPIASSVRSVRAPEAAEAPSAPSPVERLTSPVRNEIGATGDIRTLFHGSHEGVGALQPRSGPFTSVDKIGTWLTSREDAARTLYGPKVSGHAVEPEGLVDAHTDDFAAFFGQNLPLLERHLGPEAAAQIRAVPPNTKRFNELRRADPSLLSPADRSELAALQQTHTIADAALKNPEYLADFRSTLESAGYRGVRFPDSRIDLRAGDAPHDVYLLFNREPINPVSASEAGGAGIRPLTALSGAGIGAATGAAVDDEYPMRGAVLGGLAGFGAGAVLPRAPKGGTGRRVLGAAAEAPPRRAFEMSPDDLPEAFHGGTGTVPRPATTRGRRPHSLGEGFYGATDAESTGFYGPYVSRYDVSPDAKILRGTTLMSDAHPDLVAEVESFVDSTPVVSRKSGERITSEGLRNLQERPYGWYRESPEWVQAIDEYARANGYDIVHWQKNPAEVFDLAQEVVVHNPDALSFSGADISARQAVRGVPETTTDQLLRPIRNEIGAAGDDVSRATRPGYLPRSWRGDVGRSRAFEEGIAAADASLSRDAHRFDPESPEALEFERGWRSRQRRTPSTGEASTPTPEQMPEVLQRALDDAQGASSPAAPRYVIEPAEQGRYRIIDSQTGRVEEEVGGIGAQRTAQSLAQRYETERGAAASQNAGPLAGSRVVDEKGTPRVVYHGTPKGFEEFDPAQLDPDAQYGPGYYFTENPDVAGGPSLGGRKEFGYATPPDGVVPSGAAPNVRPARLGIRNPFDVEASYTADELQDLLERVEAEPDGVVHALNYATRDGRRTRRLSGDEFYEALSEAYGGDRAAANDALRKAGHDGITHIGGGNTGTSPHRVWIAFERPQIRSAFGPAVDASQVGAVGDISSLSASVDVGTPQGKGRSDVARGRNPDATLFRRLRDPEAASAAEEQYLDSYADALEEFERSGRVHPFNGGPPIEDPQLGNASLAMMRATAGAGAGGLVGYATGDENDELGRAGRAFAGAVAGAGLGLAPEVIRSVRHVAGNEIGAVLPDPERLMADALARRGQQASPIDLFALAGGEMSPEDFAARYGVSPSIASRYQSHARSFGMDPMDGDGFIESISRGPEREGFEYQPAPAPRPFEGVTDDGFLPPDAPEPKYGSGEGQIGLSARSPEGVTTLRRSIMLANPAGRVRDYVSNGLFATAETASDLPATVVDALIDRLPGMRGQRTKSFNLRATATAAWKGATEGNRDLVRAIVGKERLSRAGTAAEGAASDAVEGVDRVVMANPALDAFVRVTGRIAGSVDAPAAVYAYEKSIAEQARVMVLNERLGGGARLSRADAAARVAELTANPTDEMKALAVSALAQATFTNESVGSRLVGGLRDATIADADKGRADMPWVRAGLDFVTPFRRVPGAVAGKTLEYSPLGAVKVARDAVRLYRMATGGAADAVEVAALRRGLSQTAGRVVVGGTVIWIGSELASQGLMTGTHVPPELKNDGAQPMSIRIQGRWWPLSQMSPVGPMLAVGAEMHNEGVGESGLTLGQSVTDATLMRGMGDARAAVTRPDKAESFAESAASSFVPPIVGQVARIVDPVRRNPDGPVDAVQARIPGLSQNVEPRRGPLGEEYKETAPLPGRIALALLDATRSSPDRRGDDPMTDRFIDLGFRMPGTTRRKEETRDQFLRRISRQPEAERREGETPEQYALRSARWRRPRPAETPEEFRTRESQVRGAADHYLRMITQDERPTDPQAADLWTQYHMMDEALKQAAQQNPQGFRGIDINELIAQQRRELLAKVVEEIKSAWQQANPY